MSLFYHFNKLELLRDATETEIKHRTILPHSAEHEKQPVFESCKMIFADPHTDVNVCVQWTID